MPVSPVKDDRDLPLAEAGLFREEEPELRGQLRLITLAWMFGSVWMYTITGAAMTRFGQALGMSDAQFGLLAAVPHLATLMQLPASYLLETRGGRRRMFIVWAIASRLMWVAVAAIPWVLRGHDRWWPAALMGVVFVTWSIGHLSGPAWMNWMADVVPRRVRGRYFAARTRWTQPIGMVTTLGIGWALDVAERHQAVSPGTMLRVTSVMIAIAGVVGAIDSACFLWVRDPVKQKLLAVEAWWRHLREPWENRSFRWMLGYCFTMMLGVGFLGQYVFLFALEVVKLSNWMTNICVVGVPLLVATVSVSVWGRLMDRFGKRPVAVIAGFLTVLGPAGWFIADAESWVLGYGLTLISPIAFSGLELSVFNILLGFSSANEQGEGGGKSRANRGGSAYVAWYSTIAACGGVLSGLMGAWLVTVFKGWRWESPWGTPMTYHHVLFMVSAGLRFAAVLFVLGLSEPRAVGTRDAIRMISAGLWNNFVGAAAAPVRLAGRLSGIAYRVDAGGRRRASSSKRGGER
ncbi:MAG: MFS transporter [Phycisphaeraceae bacterium]|nr:MFS transporter [Phycisphaeraceae bacterium]